MLDVLHVLFRFGTSSAFGNNIGAAYDFVLTGGSIKVPNLLSVLEVVCSPKRSSRLTLPSKSQQESAD